MKDRLQVIHLLEDDDAMGDLLQGLLEIEGYEVRLFSTVEAFNAEKNIPDLNLLDIFLPDGDGREVCRDLLQSKETWNTPVVLMSVYTEPRGTQVAHDFIQKPFDIDELVFKIEKQLA